MAYALRLDEARDQDRRMMQAAWTARGVDVKEMEDWLAADGAVASFERALDLADVKPSDESAVPEAAGEEAALATVISMQAFVDQVNAGMT